MESTQQHRHGNCTEAFIVHTLNYIRVFNLRMLPRENFYSLFSELPFSWPPVPGDAEAAGAAADLLAFSELYRAWMLCHVETATLQDIPLLEFPEEISPTFC